MAFILNRMSLGMVALWIPLVASTTDYCSDVQCARGQHTMCTYPDDIPGSECGDSLYGQGVNAEQIEELLHVHNRYRDYVAAGKETRTLGGPMPSAANMGALTWDAELARIAQRWALQCHFGHDECRVVPSMKVGQNVAIAGSSVPAPPNVTSLAFMWYEKEVGLYSAPGVDSFVFSMSTGHFTQWIWATSYKLGCGYSGFRGGIMHKHFLVCNYGPAGNILRWPLYRQGKPCSACPEGTTCGGDARYPNLCSATGGGVPGGDKGFAEGVFSGNLYEASASGRSSPLAGLCVVLAASLAFILPTAVL